METPRKVQGDVLAEVSYQLTFDDLVTYVVHFQSAGEALPQNRRLLLRANAGMCLICGIPVAMIAAEMYARAATPSNTGGVDWLALAVLWLLTVLAFTLYNSWPWQSKSTVIDNLRKNARAMIRAGSIAIDPGPQSIRLTTDGLIHSGRWSGSEYLWHGAINRVEQSRNLIFILTRWRYGFIIPKRAFSTPAQAEGFYSLVSRLIKENGGGIDRDLIEYARQHDLKCPKCKYTLMGMNSAACPECGTPLSLGMFSPASPSDGIDSTSTGT